MCVTGHTGIVIPDSLDLSKRMNFYALLCLGTRCEQPAFDRSVPFGLVSSRFCVEFIKFVTAHILLLHYEGLPFAISYGEYRQRIFATWKEDDSFIQKQIGFSNYQEGHTSQNSKFEIVTTKVHGLQRTYTTIFATKQAENRPKIGIMKKAGPAFWVPAFNIQSRAKLLKTRYSSLICSINCMNTFHLY